MLPALSNLYAAALQIRTLMMPFAFVLCVLGIGEMAWKAGSDTRAILGVLIKITLIVSLIVSYPTMMENGQKAFTAMRSEFTNAQDAKFVLLLRSRIQNQPSDSWTDLGKIVPAAIGMFFQGIGRFMLLVLRFFQEFAIAGLIAVSPLLIGFLFFTPTQSLGIQFGMTSLTVLLWQVGICLVDIVVAAISDLLFGPITTGGLVMVASNMFVVENWLLFPFIMAFASIITVFFYLSVPFVAGAIMKGASGTTAALQAGVQNTMQAAGMALGVGLTAAGAAATMGGSAAAQGAVAAGKGASEVGSAGVRIASDVSGSVGGMDGGGGDVPPPPPMPTGGGSGEVASPDNPSLVARQTSSNAFAVVDHAKGTISHHPGSLATPYAAQAAFNAHSSKAEPLEEGSPLNTRNS